MEINQPVTDFTLNDLDGRPHSLSDYSGKIVIVNFWSAECPQSERADRALMNDLQRWGGKVVYLAVASNMNETPQQINAVANQRGVGPVLLDRACRLADLWGARTTPHVYVIDAASMLRYQGALDDVTFRNRTAQKIFVAASVDSILAGNLPPIQEMPPYGCTIVREGSQ
jgi:peroxiredoxin